MGFDKSNIECIHGQNFQHINKILNKRRGSELVLEELCCSPGSIMKEP